MPKYAVAVADTLDATKCQIEFHDAEDEYCATLLHSMVENITKTMDDEDIPVDLDGLCEVLHDDANLLVGVAEVQ